MNARVVKTMTVLAAVLVAATISGCGDMPLERGVSGAGLGAAAGAVGGALVGAPGTGAAVGAAVGGAAGALTTRRQINFGRPIWQR